jgi:hypothetical protein
MRRRFAIISLSIAWLLATGSQWDLVQAIAWGRMFVGYARTMSLAKSVKETFDPEKPCALCYAVHKAKQQQENQTIPTEVRLREKMLLIFQPVAVLLTATPVANRWLIHDQEPLSAGRPSPPVPPPRARAQA